IDVVGRAEHVQRCERHAVELRRHDVESGILLIGTYGCANYEEDLLDEISPKQMLATVTTEIELADAVYHRDTVLDPAAE
ncbi:hypothetical protein, partial [Alistipes putredinis]|uniref:hypothetical protein n=1 Tax=Alistipes putredinis TaxID=28117 RepID=UPI003AB7003C